jgi:hypothetical protein
MMHVYAFTDPAGSPIDLAGIDGAPVELLVGPSAAAVVSAHAEAPEPSAENILRHELVVEQVMEHRSVLPARFGPAPWTRADIEVLLRDPTLTPALARVRDRIELAIRVVATDTEAKESGNRADGPGTGREHLLQLVAQRDAAKRARSAHHKVADRVRDRLSTVSEDVLPRPTGPRRVVWHAVFLVERRRRADFEQTVSDLAQGLEPDLTVLCTGPWPPYNFVPGLTVPIAGAAR